MRQMRREPCRERAGPQLGVGIQQDDPLARSLRDALRYLVAWTAKEQRAFTVEELPALIQTATGVDTREVIEEWLRPLL